jgi:hypothetical protein
MKITCMHKKNRIQDAKKRKTSFFPRFVKCKHSNALMFKEKERLREHKNMFKERERLREHKNA